MEENLIDQTGKVKLVNQNGWGYILLDNRRELGIKKDVYFHASNLLDEFIDWEDVKIGQKVNIGYIESNELGYQANDVDIPELSTIDGVPEEE